VSNFIFNKFLSKSYKFSSTINTIKTIEEVSSAELTETLLNLIDLKNELTKSSISSYYKIKKHLSKINEIGLSFGSMFLNNHQNYPKSKKIREFIFKIGETADILTYLISLTIDGLEKGTLNKKVTIKMTEIIQNVSHIASIGSSLTSMLVSRESNLGLYQLDNIQNVLDMTLKLTSITKYISTIYVIKGKDNSINQAKH